MASARLSVLDPDECLAIHAATRDLLRDTGVNVFSPLARDVLAGAGAVVDANGPRVRIPGNLLDTLLESAPKKVVLAHRDGRALAIPDGRSHVTTDGAGVNVLDLETGVRRPSASKDLADLTRVADALDVVDVQWPMVVAGDAPQDRHALAEVAIALENTTKNVQHEALSAAEASAMVDMAAAVVGGREELRKRPIVSSVQCPVSPLILEEGSTEGLITLARAGVPVVPISMVLMGGSSPVDLASALVVSNAEILASLCVAQAAAPGAPVIWSICSGPIDMKVGSFAAGSPEAGLLCAAGVDMARHYGLPCLTAGFVTDAAEPGSQAGAEKIGTGLLAMLAGADLISGIGSLEADSCLSLEQLVLDADLVDYARRILDPFRVGEDTIHMDILSRLGPGGNFLKEKHTLQHFRRAIWTPRFLLRDGYREDHRGEDRTRERARARAVELRDSHRVRPLDDDIRARVWELAGMPPLTA